MQQETLSILIPVYNEARTVRTLLGRVLASPCPIPIEVVCVDDCSTDRSREILLEASKADPRIRVFTQPRNMGKGAAIRAAIGHMTGTIAIIQDADLEYDPSDYPALLAPILDGRADAVFGSRFAAPSQRKVMLFWHTLANRMLTLAANVLNDINLTDMETCYKAVRSDILRRIPLQSNRFGIEPELTTRLAQWGARIYEVPVSYHGRTVAEGKKIGLKDAFDAVWCLLRYRFLDTRFTTHDGFYTLQSLRRARRFNRWMLAQFEDAIGKRVLEAGCGIGNFTEQLLDRERLVCADNDPLYTDLIQRRFGHLENIKVISADLADRDLPGGSAPERLDTVICLNVVEHIEDDAGVLRNFHDLLAPGGHAIVLVPAHAWLYGACDHAIGHVRRYSRRDLSERMQAAGFEIVRCREFNRLGVAGWMLNKLLGRAKLSPFQMRVYELLMPLARCVELLGFAPGLSVIAIGRKPRAASA